MFIIIMGLLKGEERTIAEGNQIPSDEFAKLSQMRMVRTIHPVGQGAFYSERFVDSDGKTVFLAVYDCGSTNRKKLNYEIEGYFHEDDVIDLLFISHLDNDHVNGVQKLLERQVPVKHLVLPFMDNNTKSLYLLAGKGVIKQLVQDPKSLFKGCKVIYVKPVNKDLEDLEPFELNDDNPEEEYIPSGTSILYGKVGDWCYVPYNYEYSEGHEQLLQGLGYAKVDIEDIINVQSRKELKEKYTQICSNGVNNTSLVVFSGGCSDKVEYNSRLLSHNLCAANINEGSLYLGDIDLNQKVSSLDLMDDMLKRLESVSGHIGLVQLPHHGAKQNFNSGLFSIGHYPKVYFASYGNSNIYKHPSPRVWEEVCSHGMLCCGIDENRQSTLTQAVGINSKNKNV